jgi:site-specific recombinase XerC
LAIPDLDRLVQFYFDKGLSSASHRTYTTGIKRFTNFCTKYNIHQPYPVTQSLLCYYISYLANEGLAASSIKVYLAALRHKQIALGLPESAHATMPKLKLVSAEQKPQPPRSNNVSRSHPLFCTRSGHCGRTRLGNQTRSCYGPPAQQPSLVSSG